MVDKNKGVVCCLLAKLAIMLSEKKKIRRKMRYSSAELLETDVPGDDAIVVSAGKLRKLWDSLSELRSSLCERRQERTV